jgi:hypothetical protein
MAQDVVLPADGRRRRRFDFSLKTPLPRCHRMMVYGAARATRASVLLRSRYRRSHRSTPQHLQGKPDQAPPTRRQVCAVTGRLSPGCSVRKMGDWIRGPSGRDTGRFGAALPSLRVSTTSAGLQYLPVSRGASADCGTESAQAAAGAVLVRGDTTAKHAPWQAKDSNAADFTKRRASTHWQSARRQSVVAGIPGVGRSRRGSSASAAGSVASSKDSYGRDALRKVCTTPG